MVVIQVGQNIFCSQWHDGTIVGVAASRLQGLRLSLEFGLLSVKFCMLFPWLFGLAPTSKKHACRWIAFRC